PRLLGEQHPVERAAAEAAVRLRDRDAEHAHLCDALPALHRAAALAREGVAHRLRGTLTLEQLAEGALELALLVGECEAPYSPFLAPAGEGEGRGGFPLGSPSTRSATTLRWISLVPA